MGWLSILCFFSILAHSGLTEADAAFAMLLGRTISSVAEADFGQALRKRWWTPAEPEENGELLLPVGPDGVGLRVEGVFGRIVPVFRGGASRFAVVERE